MPHTQLLVSVRSAAEAATALAGGAAIIDIKEPSRGSLGRADDRVMAEVVDLVAGRCLVSAAMGELAEAPRLPNVCLDYAKWGLAGMGENWQQHLKHTLNQVRQNYPTVRPVAVAYGDWRRAGAPAPQDILAFAIDQPCGALLVDTFEKDGTTLFDWLNYQDLEQLCRKCRSAALPIALAGSLKPKEIGWATTLEPDWIAVRGAACSENQRQGAIELSRVQNLSLLLSSITVVP